MNRKQVSELMTDVSVAMTTFFLVIFTLALGVVFIPLTAFLDAVALHVFTLARDIRDIFRDKFGE